jgi:hypothetical protein
MTPAGFVSEIIRARQLRVSPFDHAVFRVAEK